MKATVLGSTGYTGMVLLRLLAGHPEVDAIIPVSSSRAGNHLLDFDAGLGKGPSRYTGILEKTAETNGKMVTVEEAEKHSSDVVFSALPHLASAEVCRPFFGKSVVIDLSADFRITDSGTFEKAYGTVPPRPDLLKDRVYGLCEWYKEEIKRGDIIANPGCYPTAALLPLLPLAEKGLISGTLITNALSGISGAGKKTKPNLIFCERTENTCAYAPGKTHRHTLEILQEIEAKNSSLDLFFTPHLVPLKRGMAVTTVGELKPGTTPEDVEKCMDTAYAETPFVDIRKNRIPETRDVWGSNRCDIGWHIEENRIFLFSVIDNLMKGASGQAVQNMNIRLGFDETAGLPLHGKV